MSEIEKIIIRYNKRENDLKSVFVDPVFEKFKNGERETNYKKIIFKIFGDQLTDCRVLEIGAGNGINISFFKRIGIPPQNIWANELLPKRVARLKEIHSDINILEGDALSIHDIGFFDIILQSLVFTSILDYDFKKNLAEKILGLLRSTGVILWYDFVYNNPKNPDVKGITKSEIRSLFPGMDIYFRRVTLAPPIGRKIGKLYNIINLIAPFLRTHVIAVINK